VKNSSEGRSDGAETGKKFCKEQGTRALLGKDAFGATNAGVWLKRNLAEELQNFDAFATAKLIPDGVGQDSGEHGDEEGSKKAESAGTGQSAGGEEKRKRGNRETELLEENPAEQDHVSVMK
jgi:hypothetical protein